MASSQIPHTIVDAPDSIGAFAKQNPGIIINLRPDRWSKKTLLAFKNDRHWQIRANLNNGWFMSPEFTAFLADLKDKTPLLICYQGTAGEIMVAADIADRTVWVDCKSKEKGVHAAIRFNSDEVGQVWGSYILAVAPLREVIEVKNRIDPTGEKFVALFKKFGKI